MDQESTSPAPAAYPDDLLGTAKQRFKASYDHYDGWRRDAEQDYAFVAGDQWDQDDIDRLKEQLRPVVTFNRVAPMVDAVLGHEINNRQEVRYIPRELGDAGVNEVLTGAADWVRDECDAEDEDTDAFFDCLVCGMGWTDTRMDWEADPEGKIVIERVDPLYCFGDPGARKRNLADGQYAFRVSLDFPLSKARAMFPDADIRPGGRGIWGLSIEPSGNVDVNRPGEDYSDELTGEREDIAGVDLIEYQWLETEPAIAMRHPQTGAMELLSEDEAMKAGTVLAQMGIQPQMERRVRQVAYRAYFAGDDVLWYGKNLDPERLTLCCITGKRDRNNNWWRGLVHGLKDPQRWANRFFVLMMDIIASNSKGGVMYEPGAFLDPRAAEEDWARTNGFVPVEEGAISQEKIKEKPRSEIPLSLVQMMQFSLDAFPQTTGISPELMGATGRDQAGVLEYQRRQSGLAILAPFFDSLRRYRKMQGRVLLNFIQAYISDGRLVRIVGSDGSKQFIPLAQQETTGTYDVIVDEAPTSPNQKERTWQVLMAMFPPQVIMSLPPAMQLEILRYAPLPESFVNRIAELADQMGQDPMQQAAQQLAVQQQQAEVQKTQSETDENQADVLLKTAKAQSERAQIPANIIQKTMDRRPKVA